MEYSITVVAHRGYSGKFPENTLLAYQAAYAYGARWMECDIQLSKDLVPFVHHDENLKRMADVDLSLLNMNAKEVQKFTAFYPEKFGTEFISNPFCTLKTLSKWMKNHRDVKMFVEIKKHSLHQFGIQNTMQAVYKVIKNIQHQCIIISFDPYVVDYASKKYDLKNGWVIPEWSIEVETRARSMQPDFLFSNKDIMPADPSNWWKGDWQWANYNVDDIKEIPEWIEKRIPFIETNEIGDILKNEYIKRAQNESI